MATLERIVEFLQAAAVPVATAEIAAHLGETLEEVSNALEGAGPSLEVVDGCWFVASSAVPNSSQDPPSDAGVSGAGLSASAKRRALAVLDANQLRAFVAEFDVFVSDRRSREALIQSLADGRRVDFANLLARLQRDDLKAMCEALELPDIGKEKAVLVARILAFRAPAASAASAPSFDEQNARVRVLLELTRDELAEIADTAAVDVVDRRVQRHFVSALAPTNSMALAEALETLTRARLKTICSALGLDDSGREKAPILARIAQFAGEPAPPPIDLWAGLGDLGTALRTVFGTGLSIEEENGFWPAKANLDIRGRLVPLDLHVRPIGGTSRAAQERRFQNPAGRAPIRATSGRACILMGLWLEEGASRAVCVCFDAYRRLDRESRFSLFMPRTLLEQAADTGYASHVNASGETVSAFRPAAMDRYLEAFAKEALYGEHNPGASAQVDREQSPLTQAVAGADAVEIRPKAGMFAAFARLNYKPWFALAEFVDNAVQSFLSNRQALAEVSGEGPLVVDINLDEDELSITDRAAGIRLADFPRAFSPATPPSDPSGLSEFGLGMKAAACWFARQWSVRTCALGEAVERTIEFDVPQITRHGIDTLPILRRDARAQDHYTVVTMRQLRARPRGQTIRKIKEHLASIYRQLIANGTLRLRFTAGEKTEELSFSPPKLLEAPYFATPTAPAVRWRTEISIDLEERRVTGWVGVLESGKYALAGLSVFRRGRLIEGSIGEAYRPHEIFGAHNSFASQRVVGELNVEGFDVTHTKDGIQWGDYEERVLYELRRILDDERLPILAQAAGHRARKEGAQLPPKFGVDAIRGVESALGVIEMQGVLDDPTPPESETVEVALPPAVEATLQQRSVRMHVTGDTALDVVLELVRDKPSDWLSCHIAQEEGRERLCVRLNLDHDFSVEHINVNEETLEPMFRLAAAIGLAERQARKEGVKNAGRIRSIMNDLLRRGFSQPVGDE